MPKSGYFGRAETSFTETQCKHLTVKIRTNKQVALVRWQSAICNTLQMVLYLPSSSIIWNLGYSEASFRQRGKVTDFISTMREQQHTRTP